MMGALGEGDRRVDCSVPLALPKILMTGGRREDEPEASPNVDTTADPVKVPVGVTLRRDIIDMAEPGRGLGLGLGGALAMSVSVSVSVCIAVPASDRCKSPWEVGEAKRGVSSNLSSFRTLGPGDVESLRL
jgi:hypothetical protein